MRECSTAVQVVDQAAPASVTCERCGAEIPVPALRSAPKARVPRVRRSRVGPATPAPRDLRGASFGVLGVLRATANVLGANFASFVLVAVIANVPYVLSELFLLPMLPAAKPGVSAFESGIALRVARLAVTLLCSNLAAAVVAPGVIAHLAGRKLTLEELQRRGLASLWRAAQVSVAVSVIVGLSGLMVIPALVVAAALQVSVPAAVLEGLGPMEALTRSRALTEGYRWQVFFASTSLFAAALALILILSAGFREQGLEAAVRVLGLSVPMQIVLVLWRAVEAVMQTVIYARLRALHGETVVELRAATATDVFD